MGGDATLIHNMRYLVKRAGWLLLPAIVLAAVVFLLADQASAQFDVGAIVCPILLALKGLLPFLGFIIDALLAAFGCIAPSP